MRATTLETGRRVVRRLRSIPEEVRTRRRRERIERLLARREHRFYDSEELFDELQRSYPPKPDYGYDPATSWWRGVQRAHWLLSTASLERPGAHVLEVACGDGMVGHALASYGHRVSLCDLEDWREQRSRALAFHPADVARELPFPDDAFDAVASYNAFIHFLDPENALREMVRVCRPGGTVYLDFGFLWPCAWGLHAYRTVRMPYAHLLFSPEFLGTKLDQLGFDAWPAMLGRPRSGTIPLNGWRLGQYRGIFARSGCAEVAGSTKTDASHLGIVERFPDAFSGLALTYEDLTTTMVSVALKKPQGRAVAGANGSHAAATTATAPTANGAA